MIESLFGDLGPRSLGPPAGRTAAEPGGQATSTALAQTSIDVVVDSSPAAAMRQHFAEQRRDLDRASPMITLLDPSQLWARQVVQALSGAAGQPVQRLNLREPGTLRTLAVIERTLVPRHRNPPLRVYCTDVRAGVVDSALQHEEIATALAEGSQLAAVLVGTLQPQALQRLVQALLAATHQAQWRCPQLLFLLPCAASATAQRITEQAWPADVAVDVVVEPLGSVSSVWNRLLTAWEDRLATHRQPTPDAVVRADRPSTEDGHAPTATPAKPSTSALQRLLWPLQRTDGLLACGIVDLHSGDLLACQGAPDDHEASGQDPIVALGPVTTALCAARQGHGRAAPEQAASDEILVTAGARQMLLRALPGSAELGFVALVARARINLALLRFKLLDLATLGSDAGGKTR